MRSALLVLTAAFVCSPLFGQETAESGRPAAEKLAGWSLVRALPAAEAHQAAAAMGDWVFAITNARIAKYDRRTGERLAVSTGEAKHLNSGFVWDGQLYCAHSNYPRKPEMSEIMVLDPETMRLAVFKEFGNFGGSLTWAVRHEGAWWCNFALYGDDNARTFVVKFDNAWRELDRWTYPREVLQAIGRASLSGGLWLEGSLLVTDHDHPVIYRLRVPEEGQVLDFLGHEPSPFPGQGIGIDPETHGLVGIHRFKRQVIFAEQNGQ